VISNDALNHGPARLAVVTPFTTHARRAPLWVSVEPPEGGLRKSSFVICEGARSISTERLIRRLGSVDAGTLASVEDRLRVLFSL
jgi:mRNA interferase MazF